MALWSQVGVQLGPLAARSALEHVRVMEQPIKERGHRRGVAEELPPSSTGLFDVSSVDARS